MKFLSEKWMEGYEAALSKSFSSDTTTTGISAKVAEVYKNVPEGGDIWMSIEWEDGVLVEFAHGKGADTAPRDADFTLIGDYSSWVGMLSLKEDMVDTIMSGKVALRGNLMKFQPVMKPFVNAVLLQGAIRPSGNVVLTGVLRKAAGIVDKKMFS